MRFVIDAFSAQNVNPSLFWKVENGVFKAPAMFAITHINMVFFNWDHGIECLIYVFTKSIGAIYIFLILRNRLIRNPTIGCLTFGCALLLWFSLSQWDNYLLSAGGYSFLVATVFLMILYLAARSLSAPCFFNLTGLTCCLLISFLFVSSSYSVSLGISLILLSFYGLISNRIRLRLPIITINAFFISVASFILTVIYLYCPSLEVRDGALSIKSPLKLLGFFLGMLPGALFHPERISTTTLLAAGTIVLFLYHLTIYHGMRSGKITAIRLFSIGLVIFAMVNAGIVALGRHGYGIAYSASGRYTTFQLMGLLGLLIYWMPSNFASNAIIKTGTHIKRIVYFVSIAFLCGSSLMLTNQESKIRPYRADYFKKMNAIVVSNQPLTDDDRRIFQADDIKNVDEFIVMIKRKNLCIDTTPLQQNEQKKP